MEDEDQSFFLGVTMVTQQRVYKEKLFMTKCVCVDTFNHYLPGEEGKNM